MFSPFRNGKLNLLILPDNLRNQTSDCEKLLSLFTNVQLTLTQLLMREACFDCQ